MKVDESLIKKVREENDIVDVISEYLPLEQKGKTIFVYVHFMMIILHL